MLSVIIYSPQIFLFLFLFIYFTVAQQPSLQLVPLLMFLDLAQLDTQTHIR